MTTLIYLVNKEKFVYICVIGQYFVWVVVSEALFWVSVGYFGWVGHYLGYVGHYFGWVGVSGGELGIILGWWGWVGKYFGWVAVGGDEWEWVGVGVQFDNAR